MSIAAKAIEYAGSPEEALEIAINVTRLKLIRRGEIEVLPGRVRVNRLSISERPLASGAAKE